VLSKERMEEYAAILRAELVPALGCTEPIAVALAAAKARAVLGAFPERAEIWCSGNIVKNVKGVTVPNTGGLKGLDAAAIAGIVGGDPDRGLEVLESLGARPEAHAEIARLRDAGFCPAGLLEGEEGLHIVAKAWAGGSSAEVHLRSTHSNICLIVKDGATLLEKSEELARPQSADEDPLNVRDILEFADSVELAVVEGPLSAQVEMNTAISDEGLRGDYGVGVGKTLLKSYGGDVANRAKARAAAGSDARMSGCALPVVINSGSGNQGMTVSLPVIEYAKELGSPRERLLRALAVSNLVAIHQKRRIGRLSAYCGAVSAACGSGAGIAYLHGGGYEEVSDTIINTIANVGGMVCDGAKPSCAAKIASAVDAAIMAYHMSVEGKVFGEGEGLVEGGVEGTIDRVGRMGRVGMRSTDLEILAMMLGK